VILVNLVNHKGHELPVKEYFENSMITAASDDPVLIQKTTYTYFDFHTECKGMRFDRISLLVDRLRPSLEEMRWYHSITPPLTGLGTSGGGERVTSMQSGVVRSNCMDCLDRTNVSQSALGKWALERQLREVGVLSIKEGVEEHEEFMSMFRAGQLPLSASRSLS
jgi:hypothetical protein